MTRVVQLETVRTRAVDLATQWSIGVTESLDEEQAQLEAVTAADVQRVARQYRDPDRALVVVLRPE